MFGIRRSRGYLRSISRGDHPMISRGRAGARLQQSAPRHCPTLQRMEQNWGPLHRSAELQQWRWESRHKKSN